MQGQGIFLDKDSVQTGVFNESQLHGHGIKRFVNEEKVFKGDFQTGILHGHKSEMETDKGRYIGSVLDGEITGQGIMFFKNGDRYDGHWLNGEFHGKGKLVSENGDTF